MEELHFSDSLQIECFMSAFEAKYSPDFDFTGEYHDFWEAVYIISSKAGVSADDKIYSLSAKDMIFHKPMEFHRIWAIEGKPVHAFIFSFRLSGALAEKLSNKVIRLNSEQSEQVLRFMEEFRSHEAENSGEEAPLSDEKYNFVHSWNEENPMNTAIKCRTELFLFDIIKSELLQKEQYSSRSADIYRQTVQYMKEHGYENVYVCEIAASLNFSQAYVKKIFAEYSDTGIHTYFMKLKIKEATVLLESGLPVGEVSERLSFANANYFAVCFRREMGCSPTKYIKSR